MREFKPAAGSRQGEMPRERGTAWRNDSGECLIKNIDEWVSAHGRDDERSITAKALGPRTKSESRPSDSGSDVSGHRGDRRRGGRIEITKEPQRDVPLLGGHPPKTVERRASVLPQGLKGGSVRKESEKGGDSSVP